MPTTWAESEHQGIGEVTPMVFGRKRDPTNAATTNGVLRIDDSATASGQRLPISPLLTIIVIT